MENDSHQDNHNDKDRYRRIELITGTARRRRWSAEERARIVAESFAPGVNISAVARRNGVNGGLLHYWRKQAKASLGVGAPADGPLFVPMSVVDVGGEQGPCVLSGGVIEIAIKGAIIRVPAGVDASTLTTVLVAMRRAS